MIAPRQAAVGPPSDVARVNLNSSAEVADRGIELALPVADGSAIEVGRGLTRVQRNGSVVIAERAGQIALALAGETAVVVCDRACIKSDGQIVVGDGPIPIPFRQPLVAAFKVRGR